MQFKLLPYTLILAGLLLAQGAAHAERPAPARVKLDLPPPAELHYGIKAKQSGLLLTGDAVMRWQPAGRQYQLSSEWRADLAGKIYQSTSEGGIDDYGLAPSSFTEKRFRRGPATIGFDRAARVVRLSGGQEAALRGGEQDRSTALWQLIGMARAAPERFKPGKEIDLAVAGKGSVSGWHFQVKDHPPMATPLGEVKTVHLVRESPSDSQDQQLDIWLAPSLNWYPVRLRFSEENGEFVEHALQKIVK